ncbi:hypothetical protein FI667_g1480, partial [Globisporangium splendens]
MGPSTQREKHVARMDAARSLLRAPAASPSSANNRAPVAQIAQWSSPTFTRARARPSNLHSYLRTSVSFPLSQACSSNSTTGGSVNNQQQQHARMAASSVSSSSSAGGSAKSASGHATSHAIDSRVNSANGKTSGAKSNPQSSYIQQVEWRSQRTQATQTQEDLELNDHNGTTACNRAAGDASIRLGTFGDVRDMPMETVDFLIRVLEDRKQELLMPSGSSDKKRTVSRASSSGNNDASSASANRRNARRAANDAKNDSNNAQHEDEYTESSDESDVSPRTRAPVVRSRSYEALVQLEAILEARHQQLMKDGILEPPSAAAATATGDNQDDTTDDEDRSKAGRTDIQEEIRKMHRSVRQQRKSQAETLAVRVA